MRNVIQFFAIVLLLIVTNSIFAQKFEMGIGFSHDFNRMKLDDRFYHNHFDRDFDTLQITFNQIQMTNSISLPIFFRYRFKKGFFAELSVESKRMSLEVEGSSTYNDATLHEFTKYELSNAYSSYTGSMNFEEFYNFYFNSFFNNEREFWREDLTLRENFSVHYVQFNGGYTFSQINEYRPFLSFGIGFFQENHKGSYKKLDYDNYWSDNNYFLYRKMPVFTNTAVLLNFGAGVDFYKMRLFASFHFTGNYSFLSKAPDSRNDPINDERLFENKYPYKSFTQFRLGGTLNIIDTEKKDKLLKDKLQKAELISLGEYQEELRKFNFIIGTNLPKFTEIKSFYDKNSSSTSFFSERTPIGSTIIGSDTISNAFNYLEFYEYRDTINQNGDNDVMIYMESNSMKEITRVNKTPDFYFGGIYNLNKNFYLETSLRYYHIEIDQLMERESRPGILESDFYDANGNVTDTFLDWLFLDYNTDAAIMRNSYHNIGITQNIYYKYKARQFFDIGGHFGVSLNYWLPGKFKKERNGYNNGKYDEFFYNFWHHDVYDDDIDIEYFYLTDLYKWFEGEIDDYETYLDFNNHTFLNRFNATFNAGVDFYFERVRLSLNGEFGIGNPTFFYNNYMSVGFGLAYLLNR
jgi:hypothetical protein